ncbi:ABC transporter ATP-binding protein [Salaquimonas pukyongi]|uniref:ABC transporter ATP-binding protein n=1 Tax=Salaquimonas pukyongi TaxID=2712698 RepID=UPI00096B6F17|nr:ABC transporter ATP-binding protein [Salaquimonas pukyongi]
MGRNAKLPAGAETVLRLDGITIAFGDLVANDGISFELSKGEIVALLGENGAGKTTLMNILFGHYVADSGTVEAFGNPLPPGDPAAALQAGIGMVHQHFTLADQLTVLENIILGTESLFAPGQQRRAAREKIEKLSTDFGLEVDTAALVSDLSVGERQRVEILKALYRDVRVLILDEPTAVLTPSETDALFKTLKKLVDNGLSIIFISHKLHEVLAVSDRILVLRGGKLAGTLITAESDRSDLAALMVGDEVEETEFTSGTPGKAVFRLSGITTLHKPGRPALQNVSLDLKAGEITGLAGVSGNGQATLSAIIEGREIPEKGEIIIDGIPIRKWSPRIALAQNIGRIPEDRHAIGMIDDMNIVENVISETYASKRFARYGILDMKAGRAFAEEIIRDYDVRCPSPDIRARLLSGGNMQKLILGRALDGDPGIILANQPTRGLDIGAVSYVHKRLIEARDRGAAILLISEDLDEVRALSDRIAVISRGRLSEPTNRGELTVRELGELMAGHGFADRQDHVEDEANAA